MAVDEYLLERIRNIISPKTSNFYEKRMFGGVCFMVDEKMAFGTYQGGLMVRVGPEAVEKLQNREGAEQMIHGGRKMTGYMMLSPEAFDMEEDLEFWVDACLEFNPLAKASKKRKKKA